MDPLATAHALADAAFEAWKGIAGRTDLGDDVGMGADGTATTRADRFLDEAVIALAADHGISLLSEEAGFVDHGSDLIAVVDPLDGSRNAGRGIPFHCTSVAVGRNDLTGLEAGVVRNLVTGDLYAAARGKGATLNGVPVVPRPFDADDVLVAVIADSPGGEIQKEQDRRGHHLRDLGSAALEMCLVSTGGLDAFLVREPWLRVIDIAAGVLIVQEAGGIVLDPQTMAAPETPFNLDVRCGVMAAHSQASLEAVR